MWLWANFITVCLGGVPMEMHLFKDIYLLPKFDVSSFYRTGDIEILKLVILVTLSSSKLIFILITLGKSELMLFVPFYWLWTGQLLYWVWVSYVVKNNPNPLRLIEIQEPHRIWDNLFSMIQSAGIKNWFPQSINRL